MKRFKSAIAFLVMFVMVGTSVLTYAPMTVKAAGSELTEELTTYETGEGTTLSFNPENTGYYGLESSQNGYVNASSFYGEDGDGGENLSLSSGDGFESLFYLEGGETYDFYFYSNESETMELAFKPLELVSAEASFINPDNAVFEWNQSVRLGQIKIEMNFGEDGLYTLQSEEEWEGFRFKVCGITGVFESSATESQTDRGTAGDNAILLDCHLDELVRLPITVKSVVDNATAEIQLDVPVSLTEENSSGFYLLNAEAGLYRFQSESDCSMDLYKSSNEKLSLDSIEGSPERYLEAGQYVLYLDSWGGSAQVTVSKYDLDSLEITRYPDGDIRGYDINEDYWLGNELSYKLLNSSGETVKNFSGEEGLGGAGIYIDGNKYNGNEDNDLLTAGSHTLTVEYYGMSDSVEFTVISLEEYAKTFPELKMGTQNDVLFDEDLISQWESESRFRERFYFTAEEDGNYGMGLSVDGFEEYSYDVYIYNDEGIYDQISSESVARTKTLTAGETYLVIVYPMVYEKEESVSCDITISKAPDVNNFSVYTPPHRSVYVNRAEYLDVEQILHGMVIAVVYTDDSHVKVEYSGDNASEYAKLGIKSVIVDEEGKEVEEEEGYAVGNIYTVQLRQSQWDFEYDFEFQYVDWEEALEGNAIEEFTFEDNKEDCEVYFDWENDREIYLLDISEKTFFMMNTEIDNPTEKGGYQITMKLAEPNPYVEWDGYQAGGEYALSFHTEWQDSITLQAGTYYVIISNRNGDLGGEPLKFHMEKVALESAEVISEPVDNSVYPSCGAKLDGLKIKLTYADGSTEEVEYNSEKWELLGLKTELMNEDSGYYDELTEEEKEKVVYRIYSYSLKNGQTLGKLYFEEKGFEDNPDVVDFEMNTYQEFEFEDNYYWKVFRFTPEKDGEYRFYAVNSDISDSALYEGNTLIPVNEEQEWDTDWDKNYDYKRREVLEAGKTYYFVAKTWYHWGDVWLAITDSETDFHYVYWYHEMDPTCTEEGIAAGECVCCWEYHTKPIEPIGHDYAEEYTVDVEATAEADGSESRHCQRYDNDGNPCTATTDTRIIPKTGTVYSDVNTMVKEKDSSNLTEEEKTEVKDQVSKLTEESGDAAVVNDNLNMSDVVALEELYVASEAAVTETTVSVDENSGASVKAEGAALTVQNYIPEGNDGSTTYNANLTITTDPSTTESALVLDINMAVVDSEGNALAGAEDVQPVAPIKITMPVPAGMESGFELYHTDDDGNKEKIDYTIVEIDGQQYIEFIATSFSLYSFELDCEHIWQDVVGEFKAPTCQTDGYVVKECAVDGCDKVMTLVVAKTPKIHTYEYTDSKNETCTEKGYDIYKCKYCDETEIRNERGPLTHNYLNVVDKAATCTEEGSLHKVCEYCGDELNGQQFVIEKAPHVVAIDKAVELSCTTDGKTEGSHCAVCKEVFVTQEVTEAEGHDYVDGVCSKCGEEETPDTPVDPEDPEDPVDPVDPEDPEDPEGPEDPEDPEGPEDPEEPVTGECVWMEKVSLTEGELLLILGGAEVGEYTFAKNGNGWTIQTEDGLYIAGKDGKLNYTEESFIWTYQNARFSCKTASAGNGWFGGSFGKWWGFSSKETTYYLVSANNAVSVSTSNKNANAEFYVEKSADAHTLGAETSDGNGMHVSKCTLCNYEKYEVCTDADCELCNPAEPEAAVNVSVKVTSKTSGFGGWFGFIFGSKTTYTATISVEAEGTEVESVFYSKDDGKTWKKGTSFTSNKEITEFDIRVEAANGMTYEFTYANGTVMER